MEARVHRARAQPPARVVVEQPLSLRSAGDFRLLWAGNLVSQFGVRVGVLATSFLAIQKLSATPFQVGVLNAAQYLGLIVIGLPAGAWIDRRLRRPLMIGADLVRCVLFASVVLTGWLGLISYWQLLIVVAIGGFASVFFDVGQLSYLPSLVSREQLLDGNARLQVSQSMAVIVGPAAGGLLISATGAANAMLATTAGFALSAWQIARIRTREKPPAGAAEGSLRAQIAEGFSLIFRDPALRAIACCTSTYNLFLAMVLSLNVLFLLRTIGLSGAGAGLLLASTGLGGFCGALLGRRVASRVGRARLAWVALLASQPAALLIPLTESGWRIGLFAIGWFVTGLGSTVYNIAQVTFRQAACPERILGRVNASNRLVAWVSLPIGGVLGGLLADHLGVRPALWIGCAGLNLAVGWLLRSPLRTMPEI
jgi:MFS family permease